MRKVLLAAALLLLSSTAGWAACSGASWTVKDGAGASQTFCLGGSAGQLFPSVMNINSAGTEIFTAGAPGQVTGANGTFPATQSGTWTVQPGNTANTTAWLVTGTGGTFPVTSATFATAAKQPALGTAGVSSTDVISVQGIASGTALPVSGTVTANAGTNLNTSALAVETGGNLATVAGNIVSQGTALGAIKNTLIGGSVTTASPTYTTGQINPLSLDTSGSLRVNVVTGGTSGVVTQGSTTSGQSGMLTQGAVTTAAPSYTTAQTSPLSLTTAGALWVDGQATATNVAITDAPNNIGAQAVSSENTAVTALRKAQLVTDLVGKLIVLPYANPENSLNGQVSTSMTGTTSTAVTGMGTQGAGVRVYVTACTFSNAHATVGTDIILQDGSAGATLWNAPAGAVYGGAHLVFPTPLKTTANTGLFAANVTTGASTKISCTGYKGT